MTAREFYLLVAEMRNAQKCYFRFRTREYLDKSKKLEKQVDDEIRRVERIEAMDKDIHLPLLLY